MALIFQNCLRELLNKTEDIKYILDTTDVCLKRALCDKLLHTKYKFYTIANLKNRWSILFFDIEYNWISEKCKIFMHLNKYKREQVASIKKLSHCVITNESHVYKLIDQFVCGLVQ